MDCLKVQSTIYANPNANMKVEKALYTAKDGTEKQVAAKIMTVDTADEMSEKMNELRVCDKLHHIHRVVNVYELKFAHPSWTGDGFDILLIQEFAELGALSNEIRRRGLADPPQRWSEQQLFSFIFNGVDVLSQAQELGIAHRDIKPANVLLFADLDFKICDFGASKTVGEDTTFSTIVGTASYLSYLLVQAIRNPASVNQTKINWFKQDIVSFGLMVLNMARLSEKGSFNQPDTAQQMQEKAIAELDYSFAFKSILQQILNMDESARPDFVQLYEQLNSMPIQHELISADYPAPSLAQHTSTQSAPSGASKKRKVARKPRGLAPTVPPEDSTIREGVNPGKLARGEKVAKKEEDEESSEAEESGSESENEVELSPLDLDKATRSEMVEYVENLSEDEDLPPIDLEVATRSEIAEHIEAIEDARESDSESEEEVQ